MKVVVEKFPKLNCSKSSSISGNIVSYCREKSFHSKKKRYASIQARIDTGDKLPPLHKNQYTVAVTASGKVLEKPRPPLYGSGGAELERLLHRTRKSEDNHHRRSVFSCVA